MTRTYSLTKVTTSRTLYIEDAFKGCGKIMIQTIGCDEHIQDADTRTVKIKNIKK